MDFDLTDVQRSWREKAQSLGRELAADAAAADVVTGAARTGLLDSQADLVAAALAVEALACESAAAGMVLALHTSALVVLAGDDRFASVLRGETVSALSLSTEDVPSLESARLTGRASWVGPITPRGVAIVGARHGDEITACAVSLDAEGVQVEPVTTSALRGFVSAYVMFAAVPCVALGAPARIMARARTLIAATALGIGSPSRRESPAGAPPRPAYAPGANGPMS